MVRLSLLGAIHLEAEHGTALPAVVGRPKDLAILAYLCLATPRGFHRRDTLLALFWPDSDASRARGALNQALYRLRQSLGEDLVQARGTEEVGVNRERWWCDAVELRAAAAGQAWDTVLELYRGELLAGFHVNASPEFEQWLDQERSAAREAACAAALQLASAAAAAGEAARAGDYARRALAIKPGEESILQRLMHLLHAAGESHTALSEYDRFAARLAADLDLQPSRQSTELARRIREELAADGTPLPPHPAPIVQRVAAARGRPRWQRLAGVSAVAILLTAFAAYAMRATDLRSPAAVSIVVADFVNRTDDEYLAAAITEALTVDLAASRAVRVPGNAHVGTVLERMQVDSANVLTEPLAREVALREGFQAVLRGEVAGVGPGYVITVQLVTPDSGRVLFSARENAPRAGEIIPAVGRLSERLRREVGQSLRSARAQRPLEAVTTSSLEALKAYSAGLRVIRYTDLGDGGAAGGLPARMRADDRAVALFERAIALDSTFAAAYRALAVQLYWFGDQRLRVAQLLTRAYNLRLRLTERERLLTEGTYFHLVTGDQDRAIASFEAMLDRDPDDVVAIQHLGLLYFRRQDFKHAVELYERDWAVRGGTPAILYTSALLGAGRVARADSILEQFAALHPTQGHWLAELIRVRAGLGDFASVDTLLPRLEAVAAAGGPQKRYEAATLAGRLKVWRGYYGQGVALEYGAQPMRPPLWYALRHATAEIYVLRDTAGARRRLEMALAAWRRDSTAGSELPTAFLANTFADLGDVSRALEFADAQRPAYRFPSAPRSDAGLYKPRAYARAAAGDIAQARAILNAAEREIGCWYGSHQLNLHRARAEEIGGHPDSVIAALERLVAVPACKLALSWSDTWGPTSQAYAHERLAQLYDARGNTESAVLHYREFVQLWPAPDPVLRPRWNAARQRLAVLTERAAAEADRK